VNLTAVLSLLGVQGNYPSLQLQNLCIDSRQVHTGDLFIAIPGDKTDGRDYISQAIGNGAAAVLAQLPCELPFTPPVPVINVIDLKDSVAILAAAFYEHPARHMKMIGITGTNGKTSCSHYIAQILTAVDHKCGVIGTIGNGLLDALHTTQLTTSDSCTVQRELAQLHTAQAEYVAMEVTSHALVQGRLAGMEFNTAVYTNLSQDHLDYHKDMAEYFAAKSLLFTTYKLNNAVVNLDDKYGKKLLAQLSRDVQVITYSCSSTKADVYLKDATIHTPWGQGAFATQLIGAFNVSNVLASIATCCLQNIPLVTVLAAVQNLTAVPGRMQRVPIATQDQPQVVVDYAHTPDAISKALQALRPYTPGKLYCIVGCGGDRDRSKRPLMLRAALDNCDQVVLTQDNPRTEDPQQIIDDMLQGLQVNNKMTIQQDRAAAINETIARATNKDLILIAGKGHEDYQIIGTQKFPFSDVVVAQQALSLGVPVHE
jgi:UDP-N-acetylmuramoyl-L-alanyl-D-glutamate--2,6-diaminopimelate ligase